ncbi:MAG TPA: hypothetical protein VHV77_03785 [Pirellulales bacterium]|nr:hypothetical protein [Pirellulales bacterium]
MKDRPAGSRESIVARKRRLIAWAAGALMCCACAVRGDDRLAIPPAIPPDSVFSDSQRTPINTAMVPPSSDHLNFLPDPARPVPTNSAPTLEPVEDFPPESTEIPIIGCFSGPDKLVKQLTYRKTILPPGDYLSVIDIAIEATISPKRTLFGAPIWLTPFFTFHFFEGGHPFPMTNSTYDAGGEIRQVYQVTPRLAFDAAVAPSVYTDFMNNMPQTFRVVGRGVAIYALTPTTQLALGATYLGREDISMLPIAGILWRPSPVWEIDALFPKPRIAWSFSPPYIVDQFSRTKYAPWLGFSPIQQYWLYTAGELGGNSWTTGYNNTADILTYYDLRVGFGIEQRATRGPRGRVEIGYVFDRKISLASGPASILHDTFMLRGEMAH